MNTRRSFIIATIAALTPCPAFADGPGRIYTKTDTADTGGIHGRITGAKLTHALAIERDRTRVYQATLADGGTGFEFANLPVGRFDLLLVTADNRLIEGLGLGPAEKLSADRAKHLEAGITKADSFFNRHLSHRCGIENGVALVLVERIRDKQILRGSGEDLGSWLRRLEIIELDEAADEWQMRKTRHLYRVEIPRTAETSFFTHLHLPSLDGIRLAATRRDLGTIDLKPQSNNNP